MKIIDLVKKQMLHPGHLRSWPSGEVTFFFLCTRVRFSLCMPVTPAVPYMLTGLARCSVDSGISCGARKLARTPWVIKKKIFLQNKKKMHK